jgi:hypothetical protein
MKRTVITGIAMMGLLLTIRPGRAEDEKKQPEKVTITGVLSCQHCGKGAMKKDDPEKAASGHTRACCISEDCAKSGFMVIYGKSSYSLDEESGKLAMEYLSKEDSITRVSIVGTPNDDKTLHVMSIKAAPEEKDKDKKE